MFELTKEDYQQLEELGISNEKFTRYLEIFNEGIPFSEVCSAANIHQGIIQFTTEEQNHYADTYEATHTINVVKFTPASGAATRMFKAMHQLMSKAKNLEKFSKLLQKKEFAGLHKMVVCLEDLPFYQDILKSIENPEQFDKTELAFKAFQSMINEDGLALAELPKGLIPFHKYQNDVATAFEEHLYEAAAYASKNGDAKLHFTISEAHQAKFEAEFNAIKNRVSSETNVNFEVSFSFQKNSTDTLAVDLHNHPFRLENGKLLFRPGGHGALIENLNEVDADVIFIKNIDNISHRNNLSSNAFYKKVLAGYLLEIQQESYRWIQILLNKPKQEDLANALQFLQTKLNLDQKLTTADQMITHLNKPIRVCGMVKNEGEPGGGPYWMVNGNGNTSLQIVEKSQIDLNNPNQEKILFEATHFNPVDLVCGVRNYKGDKFDLMQYTNPNRGFITEKSLEGKSLKALELPGLWNGAMEYWNSIFVEVPTSTFCPVKTVSDLLKPLHTEGVTAR